MLLVYAICFLFAGLVLVRGSLTYYTSSAAPAWLKARKLLQVTISGVFSFGIMISIVLFMQFLVAFQKQELTIPEGLAALAVAAAGMFVLRAINSIERRQEAALALG
jgi:Na+/melibiose symporter-like transporter